MNKTKKWKKDEKQIVKISNVTHTHISLFFPRCSSNWLNLVKIFNQKNSFEMQNSSITAILVKKKQRVVNN